MPTRRKPPMQPGAVSPVEGKPRRGGARPGAGRPPANPTLKKVQIGIKLPQWLVDWLAQESEATGTPRAQIIEQALMRQHKLRGPNLDILSGLKPEDSCTSPCRFLP